MDDDKLLHESILRLAKGNAVSEYVDGAVNTKCSPDLFPTRCHANGYITALVGCGYTVTIERDDEKYKFPKD